LAAARLCDRSSKRCSCDAALLVTRWREFERCELISRLNPGSCSSTAAHAAEGPDRALRGIGI
jgi:hypothetical protein